MSDWMDAAKAAKAQADAEKAAAEEALRQQKAQEKADLERAQGKKLVETLVALLGEAATDAIIGTTYMPLEKPWIKNGPWTFKYIEPARSFNGDKQPPAFTLMHDATDNLKQTHSSNLRYNTDLITWYVHSAAELGWAIERIEGNIRKADQDAQRQRAEQERQKMEWAAREVELVKERERQAEEDAKRQAEAQAKQAAEQMKKSVILGWETEDALDHLERLCRRVRSGDELTSGQALVLAQAKYMLGDDNDDF